MNGLNTIVCLKQVPDPEAPVSGYRIDSAARRVTPIGIPPVVSPFDENALEAALRLRESCGGKVTALSVGHRLSKSVLRKSLSVGADELVIVDDPSCSSEELDGFTTGLILSEAIKRVGTYDLILTGRQASDTNAGVVGLYLAETLGIAAVTFARKFVRENGKLIVERALPDGREIVETTLPALVTVSAEVGELRSPGLKEMREAKKKPIMTWTLKDLRLEQLPERQLVLKDLAAPKRERTCFFVEGSTPEETSEKLVLKLREDHVI
jgi:electron transfer flavoprotein beta subunit